MTFPLPSTGGPTGAIARMVAEEMGKNLGQNVIVENLTGASGAIGTRAIARVEPCWRRSSWQAHAISTLREQGITDTDAES